MFTKQSVGKLGEQETVRYLQKRGYKLISLNYHSRFGEIDVIMLDGQQLVFIEVKTRTEAQFGSPAEAISYHKISKMIKTAQFFLAQHPQYQDYRFDAVEVLISPQISINHIKNITL